MELKAPTSMCLRSTSTLGDSCGCTDVQIFDIHPRHSCGCSVSLTSLSETPVDVMCPWHPPIGDFCGCSVSLTSSHRRVMWMYCVLDIHPRRVLWMYYVLDIHPRRFLSMYCVLDMPEWREMIEQVDWWTSFLQFDSKVILKAIITSGLRLGISEVSKALASCGHKAKDTTPSEIARRREA